MVEAPDIHCIIFVISYTFIVLRALCQQYRRVAVVAFRVHYQRRDDFLFELKLYFRRYGILINYFLR